MKNKLFIIIPAHNEGKRIVSVLSKVKKYAKDIIVVDDGSTDDTFKQASKVKVTVLRHVVNLGKGAAIITGADYAVQKGAETLIFMDADGQHEPKDIPRFIDAIKGKDIVFGSRKKSRSMPAVLRFGNGFINTAIRVLYGVKLTDTQSGYRALTAKAYKQVKWKSNDYRMESEMLVNVGKNNLRYKEIFIKTIYSDKYKGTTVLDGIKIVFNMLWWRISRW